MSSCRFRLADMMPKTWFHKFKHTSSRRKPDPTPVCSKGLASPSLNHHHSSRSRLEANNLDSPKRSYCRRSGRRRAVYRSSTSLGRSVASSSNWGHCPSPAAGLIPPVNGTETSTDKTNFFPLEIDSGRESVEIEYMGAEGGLSSSSSCNSFRENFSPSSTQLVIKLDDQQSTSIPCPKHTPGVKISNKEYCKMKNTISWASSHDNYGVKLGQNTPVIGRRRKSLACYRKSLSSSSPRASPVIVRFTNKKLGESLVMVKSSHNPKRDFRESMTEMIMENKVQTAKDLEDLLAGYLSLNSTHHHQDIVKAFEQILVKMSLFKFQTGSFATAPSLNKPVPFSTLIKGSASPSLG